MEVKIIKKDNERIEFLVEGITPALAGELRRIMMMGIPTLAIEWVDFVKNDSVLWDEIIANRLGLIPWIYNAKFYNLKEKCRCGGKGCTHCEVTFSLKKKGPCIVYSGDLVPSDKKIKPVYDKIPITELTEGQGLELEATAQLGLGNEHAKWQASVVGYRTIPKITVGGGLNKPEYANVCPKGVFVFKKHRLKPVKIMNCNLCMKCVDSSGGDIKVKPDESKYLFKIERTSGLKPKDIVLKSIENLSAKLKKFGKDLSKLK